MTPDRPRRILLHPGFHKSGTSSIQHFLWTNREALAPLVDIVLLRHLKEAAQICMTYSRRGNPLALIDIVDAMDRALPDRAGPARDLVISCESLSGHLPGWPGVADYSAATVTIAAIVSYLADRHPDAEIRVALSTRQAGDWLDSAWRHHLLGQRLRLDRPAFVQRHAPAADLSASLAEIAAAIDPVRVWDLPLDAAAGHPQGPGGYLLELIDLPDPLRDSLQAVPRANRGPDAALAAEMLALNRSDLGDGEVQKRKQALAQAAGLGGWVKPRQPGPA